MIPLRTSARPASNCGLTSVDEIGAGAHAPAARPGECAQRDERDVDGDEVDAARQQVRRQMACVDVFEDDDAWVLAQPPVQLPVADVERDDADGAALQHARR